MIILAFAVSATAQITHHNLIFEPGQTNLTDNQKNELDGLAGTILHDERLMIYPLTYDSIFDKLFFARNAKSQAAEIAVYAQNIGFEHLGSPANFPTAHDGMSISVNLKFNKPHQPVTTEINPKWPDHSLQHHFPPKASQFFTIDPNKDTLIIGNEGTKLLFEAGSLLSDKPVEIELKEFYSLADYMKNGLSTVSNGEFIETGGSIYLNATETESGNQVDINPDNGVGVDFTIGKENPEMQVFIRDPNIQNEINWILPSQQRNVEEDWQLTYTLVDENDEVISQHTFYSMEEYEAFLEQQERNETILKETEKEMESKLRIHDLGYINCDRFVNEELAPLMITGDKDIIAEYYLVYKDVRGVMQGNLVQNKVDFRNVPVNQDATLMAVSFIDGQAYFFQTSMNAGTGQAPQIDLQPVEESFLNEQLALLN